MRRTLCGIALAAGLLAASLPALAQEPASQPAPLPAKVTLNMEGGSAEEAFDQIARQTGIDLIVDNASLWTNADLVFLNVKDAPFWPTFIKLCQQTRVNFDQPYNNGGGLRTQALRLSSPGTGESRFSKMPMAESEGFVIFAQSAQRNYSVSYEQPTASSGVFSLQLMVLADPGLTIVSISPPTVSEAVDENGLSLMPTGNNSSSYGNQPNQLIQQTGMIRGYPDTGGRKVAKLKAQLRATALVKAVKIEIDNPLTAKLVKKELPDYDVELSTLKLTNETDKNSRNYQIKVTFRGKQNRPGTGGLVGPQSRDYWGLMNAMNLTDAAGKRYGTGKDSYGGNDASYECTMYFSPQGNDMGVPTKLSWSLPAETREILVPFEMKDMPIP